MPQEVVLFHIVSGGYTIHSEPKCQYHDDEEPTASACRISRIPRKSKSQGLGVGSVQRPLRGVQEIERDSPVGYAAFRVGAMSIGCGTRRLNGCDITPALPL